MKRLLENVRQFLTATPMLPSPERAGSLIYITALAFLVFTAGVLVADLRLPPHGIYREAYRGLLFLVDTWNSNAELPSAAFFPARSSARGLTKSSPRQISPGYTALTYLHDDRLFLIDENGHVAHVYEPKLTAEDRELFRSMYATAMRRVDQLQLVHIEKYYVFPNGDAILLLEGVGKRWASGFGVVKVDRDSNILWRYFDGKSHHDLDVAPDGRIFVLSSEKGAAPIKGLDHLGSRYEANGITILSETGKRIDHVDLYEAIRKSDYPYLNEGLDIAAHGDDHLHTNDVDFLTTEMAANFEFGRSGNLLVSMRNLHAIGVLNVPEKKFTWLTRGPWIAQHDPDILPDGNIVLYDNWGSTHAGGRSRVLEFDPSTMEILWSYEGDAETPFESDVRGSQQRLANGNTLISESSGGRVFEVDRSGSIVWEYHAPFRAGTEESHLPAVRWPRRFARDYFAPEFRGVLERQKGENILLSDLAARETIGPDGVTLAAGGPEPER